MGEAPNFVFWVALLVAMLIYPAKQWIWALSVRRLQRKLDRELGPDELAGQNRRAWVVAAIICSIFSFFFNAAMLGMPS